MMNVIRYVGKTACTASAYTQGISVQNTAVIDAISAERNVTLQFRRDGALLSVPMQSDVRDLVGVAMCVYIADELEKREEADDGWTRDFKVLVPVADPGLWSTASPQLERTLQFLSQDRFQFEFERRDGFPKSAKHRGRLPAGFDAVCLFSGGVDSLLGAYQLLKAGRKVLLVGHQAEPVTAKTQKSLAAELLRAFPNAVTLIQCRLARSMNDKPAFMLPPKLEDSHRPRSFLFLALAIAIAKATGIEEVFMPENGLIALNPPLQLCRVGTHSTRTAHPVYLTRLLGFLKTTGIYTGTIKNPFLYQSKTDMLRSLDPAMIPLVLRSVSCSHPSRYHDEGVRHCGYCIPCIYRRAAMMVCGLDRHNDYAFDVFSNRGSIRKRLPLNAYKQADIRALIPFAKRIIGAQETRLQSVILAHGYFPPEAGSEIGPSPARDYSPWTAMLRRWAAEFIQEASNRCSSTRRRAYGLSLKKVKAP